MDTIDCPKCKHEHTPSGSHEDDAGEMECEECGFKFDVEIEYDPCYSTSCIEHEYGAYQEVKKYKSIFARFCVHCGRCDLKPDDPEPQPES